MPTINEAAVLKFYIDTQGYSDQLTAIEAQAASSIATNKSEVATAIAQVNLTQSQTITALTLEVSNLKTNLTSSITATQTDLINRADQLAQDVTDITVQLTQDKATFTQDIQDALDFLKDDASVASALRTPRKIQGVGFDGTQDISLPTFTTQTDGLVPKRVGATSTKYLREDGTWVEPPDTTYALLTTANAEAGTTTTANSISAKVLKEAIQYHAPTVTNIAGNAGTATKLQTARTITLTGKVTGSVSFDGSNNASIATAITGLGVANGIATLNSNGQVPSTQLPSFVDDVLEYLNVAAFPTTGESGKIYVETTGNTTYRWGGTGYVKITSGEVSAVAGKTGIVTLTKSDVGLANADNTTDSSKSVASASKLTVARTIGGVSFDGTANINLPGVNTTGNQSTTGNASTATTLQTARTINGTSFNGSANITTTNWGTARTLTLGGTGKSVNGSADVSWSADEILPTGTNGQVLKHNGTSWIAGTDDDTSYTVMSAAEATTGTTTTARLITPAILKSAITALAPVQTSITGNAASATKLATPVQINGVNFDGSQSINIAIPGGGGGSTSYAGTATKLETARLINGIAFDGTMDINLDVYSRAQVDTAISNATPATRNATEVVTGVAKIATTAIAKAGTNDTDIITAKKLRDALNARGNAPVSACRAWVCFNGKASPPVILSSLNISSVVKNATGDYTLNFITPLENSNYAVSCGGASGLLGSKYYPGVKALGSEDVPMLKTTTQLGIACISTSTGAYLVDMSEIYVEVFC